MGWTAAHEMRDSWNITSHKGGANGLDRQFRTASAAVMSPISRGFRGRRRPDADPGRVPPGQYVTSDFPVLSAGPTPHTPLDGWSFTIDGAVDEPVSWPWDEFAGLQLATVTVDIHCVTMVQARHDLAGRVRGHAA